MKKLLAILLALCMIFALVACGGGDDADAGKDNGGSTADSGAANDGGSSDNGGSSDDGGSAAASGPAIPGYFDPDFDYASGPEYKVGYLSMQNDFLTMEFDKAFSMWATRLNIDYSPLWCPTSGSLDEFMSGIITYADQGYDGMLMTPDSTAYDRIMEVCEENDVVFFPVLGQARDYTGDGRLLATGSGYDSTTMGIAGFDKLIEWKEENFPDVSYDEVAFVSLTWSIAPEIMIRTNVQEQLWAEKFPEYGEYNELMTENPKNFFIADSASGNADQTTCQNLITQLMSSNTNIKVWLIAAAVDYYAMGANAAIENLNMVDNCCVTAYGGGALREQWDNGIQNAWRYAYCGPAGPFTEIPINALYAFMSGAATFETIYPEWVDPADKGDVFDEAGNLVEEHNFAKVCLASTWIDFENYKEYHEWSDFYSFGEGEGLFNYDVKVTDRDLYSAFDPIPENWGV